MTKKSKIEEGGKWENLQIDCLVNILGRVGMESLIVDVPFVCKSWYKTTLNPFCWKQLHFPHLNKRIWDFNPIVDRFRDRLGLKADIDFHEYEFVKGVIDRSAGFATTVDLRSCLVLDEKLINYVADKCSALKNLIIRGDENLTEMTWPLVIRKFKNLESLEIISNFSCENIVKEIGSHCEDFVSLKLVGLRLYGIWAIKDEEEVTSIVTCLPKLRFLTMKDVSIDREKLIKIIKGCVNLVCLDVRDCYGFDEHDKELSKLASHIPTFLCTGSFIHNSSDSEDFDAASDSGDSDTASDSGDSDSASDSGDSDSASDSGDSDSASDSGDSDSASDSGDSDTASDSGDSN